jgi:hypothetical protein
LRRILPRAKSGLQFLLLDTIIINTNHLPQGPKGTFACSFIPLVSSFLMGAILKTLPFIDRKGSKKRPEVLKQTKIQLPYPKLRPFRKIAISLRVWNFLFPVPATSDRLLKSIPMELFNFCHFFSKKNL